MIPRNYLIFFSWSNVRWLEWQSTKSTVDRLVEYSRIFKGSKLIFSLFSTKQMCSEIYHFIGPTYIEVETWFFVFEGY